MTIEERAARAVEIKASCNCAQAVTLAFADKLPLPEETLKKLTAPVIDGNVDAAFPILIAPSGEEMHFQRARTGEGMPFLPDGLDSIDLTLSYG